MYRTASSSVVQASEHLSLSRGSPVVAVRCPSGIRLAAPACGRSLGLRIPWVPAVRPCSRDGYAVFRRGSFGVYEVVDKTKTYRCICRRLAKSEKARRVVLYFLQIISREGGI